MKCWFCNNELNDKENEGYVYCETRECRQYTVQYSWMIIHEGDGKTISSRSFWQAGFKSTILTPSYKLREYFIKYCTTRKVMEVRERITPPWDPDDESVTVQYQWKDIIELPFHIGDQLILTPGNFKTRFPTLITFS